MDSFYALRLTAAPGGARKDTTYLASSLDEIARAWSADAAAERLAAGLLRGRRSPVDGSLVESVDLLPFVALRIPGHDDVVFDAERDPLDEELAAELFAGLIDGIDLVVDWPAARIPPLTGRLLESGEKASVPTEDGQFELLRYGVTDLEQGLFREFGGEWEDMDA